MRRCISLLKSLSNRDQLNWIEKVIMKKNWKPTSEFVQYIKQFTEDVCTRAKIPTIVRVSGRYDHHEAYDIAQQFVSIFFILMLRIFFILLLISYK